MSLESLITSIKETFGDFKLSKKKLISAAVLLLIIAITAAGSLFKEKDRHVIVASAISATLDERTPLYEAIDFPGIMDYLSGPSLGLEARAELEEGEIIIGYGTGEATVQAGESFIKGDINIKLKGMPDIKSAITLDGQALGFSMPLLSGEQVVYNYKEPKTGGLREYLSTKTLDRLDGSLETLYALSQKRGALIDGTRSIIAREFAGLEIMDAPARKQSIKGKEKTIKGYEMIIDYDSLSGMELELEALIERELGEQLSPTGLEDLNSGLRRAFKEAFAGFTGARLRVYINDGIICCLELIGDKNQALLTLDKRAPDLADLELNLTGEGGSLYISQEMEKAGDQYNYTYNYGADENSLSSIHCTYDPKEAALTVSLPGGSDRAGGFSIPGMGAAGFGNFLTEQGSGNTKEGRIFSLTIKNEEDSKSFVIFNPGELRGELALKISQSPSLERLQGPVVDVGSLDKEALDNKLYEYLGDFEELILESNIDYLIYDVLDELGVVDRITGSKPDNK